MNLIGKLFGGPAPSPMSKEKAMLELTQVENNSQDALSDFKVIQDSLRPNEDLGDATSGFVALLKSYGNDKTTVAQSDYRTIGSMLLPDERRSSAVETWLNILRNESSRDDVSGNFETIHRALEPGESRAQATQQFLELLRTEGNDKTSDVRKHFTSINQAAHKRGETRDAVLSDFKRLFGQDRASAASNFERVDQGLMATESRSFATSDMLAHIRAESSGEDGGSNFTLVNSLRRPDETREQASSAFISLLHYEGNDKTSQVQSHFRLIHDSLKTGEDRGQAVANFIGHAQRESSLDDGISNFRLVDGSVRRFETRDSVSGQFHRILDALGNDKTSQAQAAFRATDAQVSEERPRAERVDSYLAIYRQTGQPAESVQYFQAVEQSLKPGESLASASTDFCVHARAESSPADALQNFNLVSSSVRGYEERSQVTRQFVRILDQLGNDKTTQAQGAFRTIDGYVSPERSRSSLVDSYLNLLKETGSNETALKMFQTIHA